MKRYFFCLTASLAWVLSPETAQTDEYHYSYRSKLYGMIEAVPARDCAGLWIINGRQVTVSDKTKIIGPCGPAAVGRHVAVKGEERESRFLAYLIEVEREKTGETAPFEKISARFYGTVEEMPQNGYEGIWRVNGREVLVTRLTKIDPKNGLLSAGSYVEVKGDPSEGIFTVYEITLKENIYHEPVGKNGVQEKGAEQP